MLGSLILGTDFFFFNAIGEPIKRNKESYKIQAYLWLPVS